MSTTSAAESLRQLNAVDREITLLEHAVAVLSWDQETYMPRRAIDERSAQLSLLQGLIHRRVTDPACEALFAAAGCSDAAPEGRDDLEADDRAFLRQAYRRYRRATRLPQELVERLAATTSRGQAVWAAARQADDFSAFAPLLSDLVDLQLEIAERVGYEEEPYDALLDQYEPFTVTSDIDRAFGELRRELVPLVEAIATAPQVDDSVLRRDFPVAQQAAFGDRVMQALSYDLDRGRLDVSAHPFTTTLGAHDVRITTRYNRNFFNSAIFGTIHEVGHALYELGVAEKYHGSVLGEGASLGIHESQSRMWENMIGRSRDFWDHFYPLLGELFPASLADIDQEAFYRAINRVAPSLIRVEADEVTYGLHIILRFELERALLNGHCTVKELPEAWRDRSRELLGVEPERDADGVLQDIHWAMGGMGYFPTYALGNLYAAQFMEAIERDIPTLWDEVRRGEFDTLLTWLRRNIHTHGRARSARELCVSVTGTEVKATAFISYLKRKYGDLYGI